MRSFGKGLLLAFLMVCLFCPVAFATGESWLDFLDEKSREFLLADQSAVAAFEGTEIGMPFLVNEGIEGQGYYLIPFNKQGGTTGVLMIDAGQGYFQQATWTQEPVEYLPVSETGAIAKIRAIINPEARQGIAIEFNYAIDARLEWQAGQYSQSPFRPYWRMAAAGGEWIITQAGLLEEVREIGVKTADTNIAEMGEIPQGTAGFLIVGKIFDISNPALENSPFEARLTFNYDDADQDGKVDGTGIKETQLNIYNYDTGEGKWILIPNPVINAEANTISAMVNHFSLFMLAAPKPPEPEAQPQNTGGGGFSGGGGGGGGYPMLGFELQGECAGQEIIAIALNPSGNPAENATITIYNLAWKTIESKKTGKDGKAGFALQSGEYNARAEKTGYAMNTKKITIKECAQGQGNALEEQPASNEEGNALEEQAQEQTAGREIQNSGQAGQGQGILQSTGLFSLESLPNLKGAAIAIIAGALTAIMLGTALYAMGKAKGKRAA